MSYSRGTSVDMEANKLYHTLPQQRPSSAARSQPAVKRQTLSGHGDKNVEITDPLLTSDVSLSTKPTATTRDEKYSSTLPNQTSARMSLGSEMAGRKHQMSACVAENVADVALLLMPGLSGDQETDVRGGVSSTLPQETSPSAPTPSATPTKRHSVPIYTRDSPEQLEPPMSASLQPTVCDGDQRFHKASSDTTSVPYTTIVQSLEEAALDRYYSLGHTASSSRHLEPGGLSGSPSTPSQQQFGSRDTSAALRIPHPACELPSTSGFCSATKLEKHSSPSHSASMSHEPGFTPGTPGTNIVGPAGASATAFSDQIPSSSPTTLQYSRATTDSLPSTSAAVTNVEQPEPYFTTRSSQSGSGRFSDKISRQTSASSATPLHLAELAGEIHPSPTHTAELMLSGGLPMNRRRAGASPEAQHVTMRGTITRGNSVGQPVKVQLDLTETEFLRLTSQEPQIKEDFKCGCGRSRGPHIILWSLLCIPVAIAISLCIAFYNGAMAWYNLIIYFSEERTVFHKVVLCPVIILTFPVTVGVSALLISVVAAAMQISWSWHRWLAEIHDGEKGFYGWFCGQIGLPACSPYQVVVLDSSGV